MDPKTSARALIALSLGYAITVAILGTVGSAAITIVAVIGALILGALWAMRGVLLKRST